jgi:glycosyltransferase involved in cell wall biosynthesis
MRARVAIAINFSDKDWLGGKNYFASLFHAIENIGSTNIEFVLVIGVKTKTTLPIEFPWLKIIRTSWMDRLHPKWLIRQLTLRTIGIDPFFELFLWSQKINLLSHSGALRSGSQIKTISWLYDFQFLHLPEYWEPKHIKWVNKRYKDLCKFSDALIVSSNDAMRDLKSFANWCKAPSYVLHFVSNPIDFSEIITKTELIKKYNISDKYFYLPNQFWKNKNHRLVVDALAILKKEGLSITVVCTGKQYDSRNPDYFDELMRYRDQSNVVNEFQVLGVIPYKDIQALMLYSCAVINPSHFEGWSTTVEEAKTFHRPLLLSDIGVHREQAPGMGAFFDVKDAKGLAKLLLEVFNAEEFRTSEEEILKDYELRLKKFGLEYFEILNAVLNQPGP